MVIILIPNTNTKSEYTTGQGDFHEYNKASETN